MTAVAIFVKTPGYSPIKTRLARTIGRERAEVCHQKSAACVLEVVRQSGLTGYWAVAEAEAIDHPQWQSLPSIAQGEGSLGKRMQHVHDALVQEHGSAILIGADLPQLQAVDLTAAADWLNYHKPRSVLGPAQDGGFWLFGANHWYPESAWTSVRYSQADTADQFIRALNVGKWKRLATRRDIDQASDIAPVVAELNQLPEPSQRQQEFATWLSELSNA